MTKEFKQVDIKGYKQNGIVYKPKETEYKVLVEKNKSIKIRQYVEQTNSKLDDHGFAYRENEFKVGDYAEYDSYNLSYYGNIVAITDKTVTIEERYKHYSRRYRMSMHKFCWRNIDFDLNLKKNTRSMYI